MYTERDQKIAALADTLKRGHFSLTVPPDVDATAIATIVTKHQVDRVIDFGCGTAIEDTLVAAGFRVWRSVANQRDDYSEMLNPDRKRTVTVIKVYGSEAHRETLPQVSPRWWRVADNIQQDIRRCFTTSTVILVEIDPSQEAVARAIFAAQCSMGRMARQHILLIRQSTVEAMGKDFGRDAKYWQDTYGIKTVIVPDYQGATYLTAGR